MNTENMIKAIEANKAALEIHEAFAKATEAYTSNPSAETLANLVEANKAVQAIKL